MGYCPQTDFLFTNASFVGGMGSVVNLAGNYFIYNFSPNGTMADIRAMNADFAVVGKDIRVALDNHEQKVIEQKKSDS
jgi:hypothetical protein